MGWNYDIQDIEPEDRDKIDKIPPIERFQRNFLEDEMEEEIKSEKGFDREEDTPKWVYNPSV